MPQLEQFELHARELLVDLSRFRREQRGIAWGNAVRDAFPSLSVTLADDGVKRGRIRRVKMGAGEFFTVESAPADVFHQASLNGQHHPHISLMIQSAGSIEVSQSGTRSRLATGDLCMIDEAKSFRLRNDENSAILFLRMPRAAALSRYPALEKLFGTAFPGDSRGTRMLADALLRFAEEAHAIGEAQRAALMNSIIHMLGVAEPFNNLSDTSDWRVRRALDFIELNMGTPGLTAETIANDQRISRRRLDQLMHDELGQSIAGHLWSRRLEQAAADLRDCARSDLSIAQIAFANGFEDAAHFTRAFKRRFSLTPGQWRLN